MFLQFITIPSFHHLGISYYHLLCKDRLISQAIICLVGGYNVSWSHTAGKTLGVSSLCYSWILNQDEILYVVFFSLTSPLTHYRVKAQCWTPNWCRFWMPLSFHPCLEFRDYEFDNLKLPFLIAVITKYIKLSNQKCLGTRHRGNCGEEK